MQPKTTPNARRTTVALPTIFTLAAVLLFTAPSAIATNPTASGCGINPGPAAANCISVTMSTWDEYENCIYGPANEYGIMPAYCPTHWVVYISATNWVTPGSFDFNYPGWCSGVSAAIDVGSHDYSYECRANSPVYAANCAIPEGNWWYITVNTHGPSNPAGANVLSPGSLTVSAAAPRPQPPGGC